jgi:hypothetical protein
MPQVRDDGSNALLVYIILMALAGGVAWSVLVD